MSKTVRRKHYKIVIQRMRFTYFRTEERVWIGLPTKWNGTILDFPYTEKEYKKAVAKCYSDTGTFSLVSPGKWFRKNQQHKHRMDAKKELIRYKNDEDYEVQIHSNPKLPYWD